MTFVWPTLLWLLVLVPILAGLYVWILRRRKRSVVRYANLSIVKAAMGRSLGWRRHVPPALLLVAVAILILAVARPQAEVTLASSRATVILAMDVSGSMRADDVKPTRIQAAQLAAKKFIEQQPSNVAIGIVAFASIALLVQQPTLEREPLYNAIDNFELRRGTAIGSGILTSMRTIFPDVNFYYGIAGGTGDPLSAGLGSDIVQKPLDSKAPFAERQQGPAGACAGGAGVVRQRGHHPADRRGDDGRARPARRRADGGGLGGAGVHRRLRLDRWRGGQFRRALDAGATRRTDAAGDCAANGWTIFRGAIGR